MRHQKVQQPSRERPRGGVFSSRAFFDASGLVRQGGMEYKYFRDGSVRGVVVVVVVLLLDGTGNEYCAPLD